MIGPLSVQVPPRTCTPLLANREFRPDRAQLGATLSYERLIFLVTNPQISGEKARIPGPSDTETCTHKTLWRRMQSRTNSSPENREIYRETSLDSRGCSAFRQLLPRCDEGPSAWAAIETGKNRELSRNFRPAGIFPKRSFRSS